MSEDEVPDFCPDFRTRGGDLAERLKGFTTDEIVKFLAKERYPGGVIISFLERLDDKHVSARTFVRGARTETELLLQDISNQVYKK